MDNECWCDPETDGVNPSCPTHGKRLGAGRSTPPSCCPGRSRPGQQDATNILRGSSVGAAKGSVLVLPLKRRWFNEIKAGTKTEEYRLANDYWRKRLEGREYDFVTVTLGYPRRDDAERRITFPWRGWYRREVTSEEWGNEPREVYAIRLRDPQSECNEVRRCRSCGAKPGEFHGTFCDTPHRGIYKGKASKQRSGASGRANAESCDPQGSQR